MPEIELNTGDRIPHACLICAPSAEAALQKAKELAAAAVCSGTGKKPCGICRDCRKVEAGVHPDVVTIGRLADDKGKKKQNITVDQIRELSADAVVLPNEAARKVYILDEAETMNPAAQNAALKLLEEPPAGVVFLLCATKPMQLLATVRSRCATVKLAGAEADAPSEVKKNMVFVPSKLHSTSTSFMSSPCWAIFCWQISKASFSRCTLSWAMRRSSFVAMRCTGRRGWTTAVSATAWLPWAQSAISRPLEVSTITLSPVRTSKPLGEK